MKVTSVPYSSDEDWHALRRQHVGGSEVAAALGVSPWKTRYGLWAEKVGKVEPPKLDHLDRVLFGKLLEEPVARAVAQRTGWTVETVPDYLSGLPDIPLGGTVDRLITGHERGLGILEVKCTDWSGFTAWNDSGEPPLPHLLQIMSYMALAGAEWGTVAVLVSGNRLELFPVERRQSTIDMICEGVAEFWKLVENDEPPVPDYERDSKVVAELYASVTEGKIIDLTGNPRAAELAWSYMAAHEAEKQATKLKDAARAEIMTLLGEAQIGLAEGYRLASSTIPTIPDRVAEPGEKISGRRGYRRITISERST